MSEIEPWKQKEKVAKILIAVLNSEIRTPLTSIKGYSALLLSEEYGNLNKKQQEFASAIVDLSSGLNDLLIQLYDDFCVLDGNLRLEFENVDLRGLIQSIISDGVVLDISPNLPLIEADEGRLKRAFTGLISGIRYLHHSVNDNKVIIRAGADTDFINITILANGKDLSFNDDYANPTLFYCNTVIEQHGGKFTINRSNGDLDIVITLPIRQDGSPTHNDR